MTAGLLPLISLEGQTALVTGGSRGIGSAVCLMLAKAGAYVIVNYNSGEASAESVISGIREQGGDGKTAGFDVGNASEIDKAVAAIIGDRGKIDVLVNNAGIARDCLIGRMKDRDWNEVLCTNLSGVFYICRSVSKHMIRNRKGRIINISSTAGEAGNPGQVNYSAAKAGLIGFTKALARELAPRNILVNSVSPGIISGGMSSQLNEDQLEAIRAHVPLRRTGTAEDVAAAVLFLCCGMSDYMTGQVVRVNGGLYM